jgi:acetyl esterase/lipase
MRTVEAPMNIRGISLSVAAFAVLLLTPAFVPAAERDATDEQLQRLLRRFPDADLNKDGKLSPEEARQYLQKRQGGAAATKPATQPADAAAAAANAAPAPAAKPARPAAAKARAGNAPKPDHGDVSYGSHPSNKLDLWLAKSDKPTPLIVFIHGGGFVGGDKSSASAAAIKQCLDAGVSFASINYRFRTEASINVVLRDSARAIQFLRFHAKDYNFDKSRVAAFGGSAGAGTSLWLAFHDDLADPKSEDPVLRESTRLTAAGSSAGQASYDILKWRDVLGSDEAMKFYPEALWPAFYGLTTAEELQSDKGKALRADVDMLGLISKDDPPVWLGASDRHDALANKGDTNHSPKHSQAVKKRCDEIGVGCVLKIGNAAPADGEGTPIGFLLKHVQAELKAR